MTSDTYKERWLHETAKQISRGVFFSTVLTLNTLHVSEDMLGCSSMEDRQAS